MAKKKRDTSRDNTSYNTITVKFIADFIKQYASKEQQASFKKSAFPMMYAVPVLDDNGLQKVIPAHTSPTGKQMKAKLATKWTIPTSEKQEQEFITARYDTKKDYSHIHAKMWLVAEMAKTLEAKGYKDLIPAEGQSKEEAQSASLFDFIKEEK